MSVIGKFLEGQVPGTIWFCIWGRPHKKYRMKVSEDGKRAMEKSLTRTLVFGEVEADVNPPPGKAWQIHDGWRINGPSDQRR